MTKLIDVEVTLKHETELAYRVESHFTGETEWIPKSQCELELKGGTEEGVLTLYENIASEKRLI